VHGDDGKGLGLHVEVPQLEGHEVTRYDVPPVPAELHVRDAAGDLREEAPLGLQQAQTVVVLVCMNVGGGEVGDLP